MFKSALTVLALLLLLPYGCAPVYRFDPPRPFAGTRFYNPYASAGSLRWRRANLHAHGRAWFGVTSARQSDTEVADAYKSHGYDVVAISDYQHIAPPSVSPIPVYEHGYNAGKHHQLAIGARRVAWFDLPLWQGLNQKQYIVDQVADTAALVAIAHPAALQGYAYSDEDLRALTGYQLIEIVNGRFTTERSWDEALSAGRPVWGIGDDDTHDVTNADRFAVAWTMIASASDAPADVIDALRSGRSYVVHTTGATEGAPTELASLDVHDGTVSVTCSGPPAKITFVGERGEVKRAVALATSASYTLAPHDSYVRVEVSTPARTLFLNPVVRFDGRALPAPVATVDTLPTWLQRGGLFFVCVLLALSIVRRHSSRRRRGGGGTDEAPWRRVAAFGVLLALVIAAPARAQDPNPAPLPSTVGAETPLESTFDARLLSALPTGDSLFTVIETAVPEAISDRISTGGIGFSSPAHISVFGSSVTQTRFRVGDVDITDPSAGGTPMAIPELLFWQHVTVSTGLGSAAFGTPGAAVSLEPRRPTAAWTTSVEGSTSFGDALTATPAVAPSIARLTGWNRGSALVSGPLVPDRAGLVVAAAVTHDAEQDRGVRTADGDVASAFANLVVTASPLDEVRTVGWVQRTTSPSASPALYAATQPSAGETSVHVQSTWAHDEHGERPWRIFAGYSQNDRAPQTSFVLTPIVERLSDGPPASLGLDTGGQTDRRASAGVRGAAKRGNHAIEGGADIDFARVTSDPGFAGAIAETVDGVPARLWRYTSAAITSHRASNTLGAFVTDRIAVTDRSTLDLGLRFERLTASADGAGQGIAWSTVLPHAMYRSRLSDAHHVDWFVGGGISAYQLPLDTLAWGDPAAPSIDVFRWTGGMPLAIGPRLLNVGPGRATGRIDPNLRRPYSDDLTFGIQARPRSGVAIELAGLCRWEKELFGVVNESAAGPAYATVNVNDPGLDLFSPSDDQVLHVSNLVVPASGYQFDNVLTNPADTTARRLGAKLTTEVTAGRLFVLFGATAYEAEGVASSRGFLVSENDQGLVGELALDPNAAIYARGRLFGDRAFAGKLSAVYQFPGDITAGAIARYHDGQPFARLVIVPDLNQGPEIVRAFANGGSRFTFTATLDVRLQKTFVVDGHRFAAFADGYNLTNRSDEVEERAVTGAAFRTPTAFQPPRTVRVGARVEF